MTLSLAAYSSKLKSWVKNDANCCLVHPLTEYVRVAWSPHTTKDISAIETIQWRVACFACNDYCRNSSISAMIADLNWKSLEEDPSSVIWQCSKRSIPILWTSFSQQKVTYNLRQKPWNTLNILAPLPSPSLLQCCCSQWNSKMLSQHCTGERGVTRIFGKDCVSCKKPSG